MPLRIVVLTRIGSPAGGFRIAFKPGVFDWPEGFVALERTLRESANYITGLPKDRRFRMLRGEEQGPDTLVPRIDGREGGVHLSGGFQEDGTADIVLRASLNFRWWPLGEWAVYDGVHIRADGTSSAFSDSELAEVW